MANLGHFHDWAAYMAGALLALAAKWWYWCATGKKQGKSTWASTKEWFDVTRTQDQVSWATTLLIVWAGGYVFIARAQVGWEWIEALPVTMPFAALIGFAMEYTAPAAFKWVLGKLPWGNQTQ